MSLFLCHRFGVFFPSSSSFQDIPHAINEHDHGNEHEQNARLLSTDNETGLPLTSSKHGTFPVYMLLLPYVPLGLAIFIAGTRYFDFRNHGFDVLAGAVIGSVTAYIGFRMFCLSH